MNGSGHHGEHSKSATMGVEAAIPVPCPDDGDYATRYHELHQQLYGYAHDGRQLEITAARVEVVGTTADPPLQPPPPCHDRRNPQKPPRPSSTAAAVTPTSFSVRT